MPAAVLASALELVYALCGPLTDRAPAESDLQSQAAYIAGLSLERMALRANAPALRPEPVSG